MRFRPSCKPLSDTLMRLYAFFRNPAKFQPPEEPIHRPSSTPSPSANSTTTLPTLPLPALASDPGPVPSTPPKDVPTRKAGTTGLEGIAPPPQLTSGHPSTTRACPTPGRVHSVDAALVSREEHQLVLDVLKARQDKHGALEEEIIALKQVVGPVGVQLSRLPTMQGDLVHKPFWSQEQSSATPQLPGSVGPPSARPTTSYSPCVRPDKMFPSAPSIEVLRLEDRKSVVEGDIVESNLVADAKGGESGTPLKESKGQMEEVQFEDASGGPLPKTTRNENPARTSELHPSFVSDLSKPISVVVFVVKPSFLI
ncbi:hypothetical protein HD554DRAFT_2176488 [Boletus coccyginus]|nr:hypothetical protein HD554DRAFT_2176488 [Boletus coccyginus]